MKAKISCMGALLATACLAAPAFAQEIDPGTWDEDGDGNVTREEWDSAFETQGVFDRIDENGNGVFEAEEADEELFVYDLGMDIDDGGHVERQEFVIGTFNNYDMNGDDQLDSQEFADFSEKFQNSDLAAG